MTNVTEYVERYRLCLRHIWNSYFYIDPGLRHWDAVDSFKSLKLPLFRALVCDSVGLESRQHLFGKGFHVVLTGDIKAYLPYMQVNSRVPSSPSEGCWEVLKGPFDAEDLSQSTISLTLVDMFDWSQMRYVDLRYYVVLIERFAAHPEKVGQHALIDVEYAKVFLDEGRT